MPKIITVSNRKGGVGKSTIALNLYQYLTRKGARCALCDTDLQGSIKGLPHGFNMVDLEDIQGAPYQFVIVDTPPYQQAGLDELFTQSDFVLIPMQASGLDLRAAQHTLTILKNLGAQNYAIVLNRVKPGTKFTDQVRATIKKQGHPLLKTQIRDRVTYARAALYAEGIEAEDNDLARDEMAELTAEILTKLI